MPEYFFSTVALARPVMIVPTRSRACSREVMQAIRKLEEQSAIDSGGSTVLPDPTVVWSESVTLLLRGISAGLPW